MCVVVVGGGWGGGGGGGGLCPPEAKAFDTVKTCNKILQTFFFFYQ